MKRLILAIGFLMITSFAFADVTAEIIGKAIDENGNIVIRTRYILDGVEVMSRYPKDEQGRYYWQTRYNILNFAGMTPLQIKQRIAQDIKQFAQELIKNEYLKKANASLDLSGAIGQKITETTAVILMDSDGNGIPDKKWILKSDGTRTEENYTPPTP